MIESRAEIVPEVVTPPLPSSERAKPHRWAYPDTGDRDLRIDFIRGIVMLVLVVVHTEFFSLWNLLVWERVGLISGGEGFVLLSGVVVGMIYGRRLMKTGLPATAGKLFDRAFQLYRVHIVLIVIVGLLALVSFLDVTTITTFVDRGAGATYPLYPSDMPLMKLVGNVVLLKVGPHQIQILGLYFVLMLLAPLALWAMARGRTKVLLVISWIIYFANGAFPSMPTGAQFEYGFPLFTWQVLFFNGLAVGFHRERILAFMRGRAGRVVLGLAIVVAAAFFFVAQNTTNQLVPEWARLSLLPQGTYESIRYTFADKNTLGILRLVNYAAFLICLYALLTVAWRPINRLFDWFFVPLGSATLYVFIVHVFLLPILAALLPFGYAAGEYDRIWLNTLGHTLLLATLWLMVRYKVLYRWIPR